MMRCVCVSSCVCVCLCDRTRDGQQNIGLLLSKFHLSTVFERNGQRLEVARIRDRDRDLLPVGAASGQPMFKFNKVLANDSS